MAISLTSTSTTSTITANSADILTSDSSGEVSLRTGGSLKEIPVAVKDALNATGTAPIYAARAWVNFNGTGTVTIRASGNVSSITDNGVGDYSINFTTAMPNANYAAVFGGRATVVSIYSVITIDTANAPTTSALRMWTVNSAGVKGDTGVNINVAIFA